MSRVTVQIGRLHTIVDGVPVAVVGDALAGLGEELQSRLGRTGLGELRTVQLSSMTLETVTGNTEITAASLRTMIAERLVDWILSQEIS